MTIVLLLNCGEVISSNFISSDDPAMTFLNAIDDMCFYLYIIEFALKIVGLGIIKYFIDSWNKFDFAMIIVSMFGVFLQNLQSFLKNAQSMKSSRLLKLTKLNKLFRTFRACRTIKIISFLFYGVDTLVQLQNMVERIFICMPMIIKLLPTVISTLYIYGIIGVDIFNTVTNPSRDSPYS